jgi:4'-phosphopantetheinyl transferase
MRRVLAGWPPPPDILVLEQPHIHVWRFPLDPDEEEQAWLRSVLSPEEICRWAQFRFARDRRRFVAAHGMLRLLLSLYTGEAPAEMKFVMNSYGKPGLPPRTNGRPPAFNMAHSGDIGLFVVGPQENLGVDIERIQNDIDPLAIAGDFFSPDEVEHLCGLPPEMRQEAFFRCWTRKEAFIKGKGKGLSIPLDSFSVSLRPDDDPALLRSQIDPWDLQRWSVVDLQPGAGFAGALAAETRHFLVHRWAITPSHLKRLLVDPEFPRHIAHSYPIHQLEPVQGD